MSLVLAGNTSGSTTIQPTDAVTATITLPSATDTLVGKATTDTLTNKTLTLPVVGTTIGVGGATPSASGAGITFPATQSASTNANTLDDYEEGTFTPTIGGGITSPTYTTQIGIYTKIGNVVYFGIELRLSGGTRDTNHLNVSGLPFSASSTQAFGGSYNRTGTGLNQTLATSALPTLSIQLTKVWFYTTLNGTYIGTSLTTAAADFFISGFYTI